MITDDRHILDVEATNLSCYKLTRTLGLIITIVQSSIMSFCLKYTSCLHLQRQSELDLTGLSILLSLCLRGFCWLTVIIYMSSNANYVACHVPYEPMLFVLPLSCTVCGAVVCLYLWSVVSLPPPASVFLSAKKPININIEWKIRQCILFFPQCVLPLFYILILNYHNYTKCTLKNLLRILIQLFSSTATNTSTLPDAMIRSSDYQIWDGPEPARLVIWQTAAWLPEQHSLICLIRSQPNNTLWYILYYHMTVHFICLQLSFAEASTK